MKLLRFICFHRQFVLSVLRTAPGCGRISVCSLDCKNNIPDPDTAIDLQHFARQLAYRTPDLDACLP
jgi:hypothetical protein